MTKTKKPKKQILLRNFKISRSWDGNAVIGNANQSRTLNSSAWLVAEVLSTGGERKVQLVDEIPDRGYFLIVIGVYGGAKIVSAARSENRAADLCFCTTWAKKLGLRPGQVRYLKIGRFV